MVVGVGVLLLLLLLLLHGELLTFAARREWEGRRIVGAPLFLFFFLLYLLLLLLWQVERSASESADLLLPLRSHQKNRRTLRLLAGSAQLHVCSSSREGSSSMHEWPGALARCHPMPALLLHPGTEAKGLLPPMSHHLWPLGGGLLQPAQREPTHGDAAWHAAAE